MKQIRLENFRCYKEITIPLKAGINLLIGDNASGKTSLLKACKYVLSAFFSGFSDENTKWISPIPDDFTVSEQNGIILPEEPIRIHFNYGEDEYTLQKNSKKNSRALVSGIIPYRNHTRMLQNNANPLPLIASFTTEDIHTNRKIIPKQFVQYNQKKSFGYFECLEGNGFFPYWLKRLLVLKEGNKNLEEIEIVRKAIHNVLGEEGCNIINDMDIRPMQGKVYYLFSDGREVEAGLLSDGYKRLVNIVTDIAFRCALLNRGIYGIETIEKTKGTVLIDEIDLHLHPTLQASILKALHNTFPNLQFIATTHAPMVMTGVENNENNIVYKLSYLGDNNYTIEETETYGMDISTITKVVLNQIPRDATIDQQLSTLFGLIDDNKKEEAKKLFDKMREQRENTLPELAEAEVMLNFTLEDDEAD